MNERLDEGETGSVVAARVEATPANPELERAAASISAPTRERAPLPARPDGAVIAHIRRYHELYTFGLALVTSVVAVAGILVTLHQFSEQMAAQRRASAENMVNQFFTQVAELATLGTVETAGTGATGDTALPGQLATFVVSRAQMLIDGEETGAYAGDILRFLAANDFGGFIGRKPFESGPRINLDNSAFVGLKLDGAKLPGTRFSCLEFEDATFNKVEFVGGAIDDMRFRNAAFHSVDFTDSWLGHIDFTGVALQGNVVFTGATLYASNLSDLHFGAAFADRERFVERLADAKSLYRTRLDPETDDALRALLGEEAYAEKRRDPSGESGDAGAASDRDAVVDRAYLDAKWDERCTSVRRRTR